MRVLMMDWLLVLVVRACMPTLCIGDQTQLHPWDELLSALLYATLVVHRYR